MFLHIYNIEDHAKSLDSFSLIPVATALVCYQQTSFRYALRSEVSSKQTRSATFMASSAGGYGKLLSVGFSCSTPGGSYTVYDVSITGDAPVHGGGA